MGKDNLLKLTLKSEEVELNGEKYEVREMTGEDASEYESGIFKMVNGKPVYDTKNVKAKLVVLTLFQNGEPVFDKKDIGLVNQLPASVISKVFDVATKVNKLELDENVKNL